MNSSPATPSTYPYPDEPKWSRSEKAIARRVFDAALEGELLEVIQKTKEMANQIKEPASLWKLERYLTQRRKDIDRRYEFRSSRLTRVFGMLLCEGRIREEDLRGLQEGKIKAICSCAGIPASFTVGADTYLQATVPANSTSGYVTVTTPSGTLTSNKKFIVLR